MYNARPREERIYNRVVKRLIDLILSALITIVLSPILLILVLAIKLDSKGPVLFRQKRIGVNKTTFSILKFRTMRVDTPHAVSYTHLDVYKRQDLCRGHPHVRRRSHHC